MNLIRFHLIANQDLLPLHLPLAYQPNISHLRVFGCGVYVPIAPTHQTKMGSQCRLGIYVGFQSSSIIKYLEPLKGEVFTTHFANCHFDETVFPPLGGEKPIPEEWQKITWNESSLSHLDPPTKQSEQEVQKIIHLQDLANRLPDAFVDLAKVTKSHILVANVPSRIEIPMGKFEGIMTNEAKPQLKRGQPLGSKDTTPRKKRNIQIHAPEELINIKGLKEIDLEPQVDELITPEMVPIKKLSFETVHVHNNEEISINYVYKGKI